MEGHEFGKYCFETLPKARESAHHKRIGGDEFDVCEIQITYENPENLELSVELPLEDEKFVSLQEQDPKTSGTFMTRLKRVCIMNFTLSKIMFYSDPL